MRRQVQPRLDDADLVGVGAIGGHVADRGQTAARPIAPTPQTVFTNPSPPDRLQDGLAVGAEGCGVDVRSRIVPPGLAVRLDVVGLPALDAAVPAARHET